MTEKCAPGEHHYTKDFRWRRCKICGNTARARIAKKKKNERRNKKWQRTTE